MSELPFKTARSLTNPFLCLLPCSAEWMLDVIGAGATATTKIDWHSVWKKSPEVSALQLELESIHTEGRRRPPIETTLKSEFSTSWGYQVWALTQRAFSSYWRNPTYLMAKLMLNIAGGLFIGFTFWKSKDTLQGTQNKLFVRWATEFPSKLDTDEIIIFSGYFYGHYPRRSDYESIADDIHCVP